MMTKGTNLSCGIVGLPNVGKSTLFNALTRKCVASENYPFCTIDPNIGVVEVPDDRLNTLSVLSKSKKTVPAGVSFVDIAGLVKGASQGEGLGNKFLSNIRETDMIIHVVRCFENDDVIHVSGQIDPLSDITTINLELILSDIELANNALKKIEKQHKSKKEKPQELKTIEKILSHLNEEKPIRSLDLTEEEEELLITYPFFTAKKVIYVANVQEEDLHDIESNKFIKQVIDYAKTEGSIVIPICGKLEEEIAQLSKDEATEFLKSLEIQESGLDRLIKEAFKYLGLITFITTGELETKAWTIHSNTPANRAAGKIHGDIEKGFIRAEVVTFDDMVKYNGRVGAREAGVAKSEGKDYIVKDGDVILFFHN
jgi:ribosome-binding ATPase